jgi:ABC-type glycerol-3-phosphate transport system substrate-binding protein
MRKRASSILLLVLFASTLAGCGQPDANQTAGSSIADLATDRIEVIHFHATQQCWSCITVGEYALQTIKEKFPEEYRDGRITYQDINGELPANRDLVTKYQATGSALFINTIKNGQDNIEEDTTVWRLVNNQANFVNYFESKLRTALGQ